MDEGKDEDEDAPAGAEMGEDAGVGEGELKVISRGGDAGNGGEHRQAGCDAAPTCCVRLGWTAKTSTSRGQRPSEPNMPRPVLPPS